MKEEFTGYLKSIGITEALYKRILEIYEFYESVCPEEITGIFVTDYVRDDNSREYENFWCFSSNFGMEARKFAFEDNFDMCFIRKKVQRWEMKKKSYDFKNATQDSRLSLQINIYYVGEGNLRATGENCDRLRDIILKYVVPNFCE